MHIGYVSLSTPFGIAPMAGMTDSAFRRLVKRRGGCGLVVTEMVSAEGLVRGIDRTLEFAEYSEEEHPIAIQIFGGDPERMARAAQIVEQLGADIVDVNMGCPVPKIARQSAGCRLMREPEQAARIVSAMTRAVRIPVTVKMRAGWSNDEPNAPELARRVEDAGAAAVAVHGRTAEQSYSGKADWTLVAQIARERTIPIFGSGDCTEPEQIVERWRSGIGGVLVGRGVLRNPWLLAQAADRAAGRQPLRVTLADSGRFLLDYVDLLLSERVRPAIADRICAIAGGPRPMTADAREAPGSREQSASGQPPHDRWVINKIRALSAWYTRGFENGSRLRVAINAARSLSELREIITEFFLEPSVAPDGAACLQELSMIGISAAGGLIDAGADRQGAHSNRRKPTDG
jgi:tRNA-dihydrouridine synthase B